MSAPTCLILGSCWCQAVTVNASEGVCSFKASGMLSASGRRKLGRRVVLQSPGSGFGGRLKPARRSGIPAWVLHVSLSSALVPACCQSVSI